MTKIMQALAEFNYFAYTSFSWKRKLPIYLLSLPPLLLCILPKRILLSSLQIHSHTETFNTENNNLTSLSCIRILSPLNSYFSSSLEIDATITDHKPMKILHWHTERCSLQSLITSKPTLSSITLSLTATIIVIQYNTIPSALTCNVASLRNDIKALAVTVHLSQEPIDFYRLNHPPRPQHEVDL